MNRRDLLTAGVGAASAALLSDAPALASEPAAGGFRPRYCLNTSTIRGQELSLPEQVDVAANAGYDGIEPWMRDIEAYQQSGGSLEDLRKRIADAGLTVESAIGFAQWIVDDENARKAGLEQMKRDMDLLKQIGGVRIAAPPVGGHGGDAPDIDLFAAAERYRAVLEIGDEIGVTPQVEIWGPAKNLSRLGQAVFVAVECGHPKACVLPDVYHIFRGGTDFAGLGIIAGTAIHCFHMNDYPGGKSRTEYNDADRVFPGDGIAPLTQILQTLKRTGFNGALSLELFNRDYWQRPADEVAREGLEKMRAAVALAQ
jgi:2-keto-myo-inositol isomerase